MRDAVYEIHAVSLLPLEPGEERWPFPAANDPATWVEITADQAEHFLGVLPPKDYRNGGFFIGEASTSDHRGVTVYSRVERVAGRWWVRDLPRDKADEARERLADLLGVGNGRTLMEGGAR